MVIEKELVNLNQNKMNNNKQITAVEWLVGQLKEYNHLSYDEQSWIFEQAKEMEKQYFNDCFEEAHQAGRFEGKGIAEKDWITFEMWYNETFKLE
jgi:hypothetical protein